MDEEPDLELLRSVLVRKKKLDSEEVASLIDRELPGDQNVVNGVIALCQMGGLDYYLDLRAAKDGLIEETLEMKNAKKMLPGAKNALWKLHKILQTELPPPSAPAPPPPTHWSLPEMTDPMAKLAPSAQVDKDPKKRKVAASVFFDNVEDVATVIEDAYLLWAFCLSQGVEEKPSGYNDPDCATIQVDNLSKLFDDVSGLKWYEDVDDEVDMLDPPKKVARMLERTTNNDGNIAEDARSTSFGNAWQSNITLTHKVGVDNQSIVEKSAGSVKRSDVWLFKIEQAFGAADKGNLPSDFSAVMEWKNAQTEGADREGSHYAMSMKKGIGRQRFLVFVVAPGYVYVYGLYWRYGANKVRRVKLGQFKSLEACLKAWMQPLVWFVHHSACTQPTPALPAFSLTGSSTGSLSANVFQVKEGSNEYVYKVYDYTRQKDILEAQRRWMNWDLVQKYYPDTAEKLVDLDHLKIFRYPFQGVESGQLTQHIPASIELFREVGVQLKELHDGKWIWGDVRLGNMLFVNGKAYMIDFDFARQEDTEPVYVDGYIGNDGKLPRHPDALAGKPMKQEHDVYSYWRCFQSLCGKEGMGKPPGSTMEEVLPHIKMDDYKVPHVDDISEVEVKTSSPIRKKVNV